MANLTRLQPLDELFDELARGFWVKPFAAPQGAELRIKLDVAEDEKTFTVRAEIPGAKKEDIRVDLDEERVTVRAELKREKEEKKDEKLVYSERVYGMASRSFSLPAPIDAQGASAEYRDGILSLTLPKKANGGARRIAVS